MTPTKSQQAQEYAEKKIQETIPEEYLHNEQIYDADDIKYAYKQAFLDGYTAAEQSLWRSVEQEPSDREKILVVYYNLKYGTRYMADIYHKEAGFSWIPGDVIAWMPVPSLPDTNTEKK